MTRERVGLLSGAAARRLCVLAVLAPLSLAATTGLLRPEPISPQAALVVPVAAAEAVEPPATPGPTISPDAIDAPASVTQKTSSSQPGLGVALDARAVSVDAIPARALVAYQQAQAVMAQADPGCHLPWQLVAAIAKVESNHGRYGGALMTVDGVVHPAIYGPVLDGKRGTSLIRDTDAGLIDENATYDRAVGPLQFIPSTWTVVGVDADGDGRRDPQDIDDASLAAGVYLCSGAGDLSQLAGQRQAVHRYNHSKSYVGLVLGYYDAYLHADLAALGVLGGPGFVYPPTGGPGAEPTPGEPQPTFQVEPSKSASPSASPTVKPTGKPSPSASASATATSSPSATPSSVPTSTSSTPTSASPTESASVTTSATADATREPTGGPSTGSTTGPTDSATADPTSTATGEPTGDPSGPSGSASPTATPTGGASDPGSPDIPQALLDAWTACVATGIDVGDVPAMTQCLVDATGLPADDPGIAALLANPPVTPPTPSTQQSGRRRSRRPV